MKCDGINLAKNIFREIFVELSFIPRTVDEIVMDFDLLPRVYKYKRLIQLFDEKE